MKFARLLIAGSSGDSGKTLVTLGLISAWRHRGKSVVPFKKGPDYIDPAWLSFASGREVYNLDTWMMGEERTFCSFTKFAKSDGINLVEGNRGLHDGEDARGTHSSASLARLLKTPVILVIPVTKVTRSVAAVVLGMKLLDSEVDIAGVILNKIGGERHENIIRRAIEDETGVPVLGAIPRIKGDILPGRHLGLVTPEEHSQAKQAVSVAGQLIEDSVDLGEIEKIARNAVSLETCRTETVNEPANSFDCRIGYFKGSAFTFYYPENLQVFTDAGCTLIPVDPLVDSGIPDLDALYIGGGFPETHAAALSGNRNFLKSVNKNVDEGLPVWAECGGLMFLARSLSWKGDVFPMSGVFQVDVEMSDRPKGHGYIEAEVACENPFLPVGTRIKGHEFHYSQVKEPYSPETVFSVKRGTGLGNGRDGLIYKNVLGSYMHIHATATPEWAEAVIVKASEYKRYKASKAL